MESLNYRIKRSGNKFSMYKKIISEAKLIKRDAKESNQLRIYTTLIYANVRILLNL